MKCDQITLYFTSTSNATKKLQYNTMENSSTSIKLTLLFPPLFFSLSLHLCLLLTHTPIHNPHTSPHTYLHLLPPTDPDLALRRDDVYSPHIAPGGQPKSLFLPVTPAGSPCRLLLPLPFPQRTAGGLVQLSLWWRELYSPAGTHAVSYARKRWVTNTHRAAGGRKVPGLGQSPQVLWSAFSLSVCPERRMKMAATQLCCCLSVCLSVRRSVQLGSPQMFPRLLSGLGEIGRAHV